MAQDQTPFPQPPPQMRGSYAMPMAIITVVMVGILLHFLSDALLPFVAAAFLANIFMPMVDFFRKKSIPAVFSIILVLGIVGCVLYGMAFILSTSVTSITEIAPKYETKWNEKILPGIVSLLEGISPDLRTQAEQFDFATIIQPAQIASGISSTTNFLMSVLSGFALIMLFMLFILASNGEFRRKIKEAFPPSSSSRLTEIVSDVDSRVRRYMLNTVLMNALAAAVMYVILMLFGVDLAILWAALTFILNFIPSIGSIFAALLPIAISFLQFDSLSTPIFVAAVVLAAQLCIGSFLTPKIMGSTLNLSPLLILVSLIFWGWVWGPWGMILSVPITSTIAIIFENIPSLHPLAVMMSSNPDNVKIASRRIWRSKP